jgi:hypothetical protein
MMKIMAIVTMLDLQVREDQLMKALSSSHAAGGVLTHPFE